MKITLPHIHRWSKWEFKIVTLEDYFKGAPHITIREHEEGRLVRVCKTCGDIETKRVK